MIESLKTRHPGAAQFHLSHVFVYKTNIDILRSTYKKNVHFHRNSDFSRYMRCTRVITTVKVSSADLSLSSNRRPSRNNYEAWSDVC